MVSVQEWGGREPKTKLKTLTLPVHRVIISHTAAEGCESRVSLTDQQIRVRTSFNNLPFALRMCARLECKLYRTFIWMAGTGITLVTIFSLGAMAWCTRVAAGTTRARIRWAITMAALASLSLAPSSRLGQQMPSCTHVSCYSPKVCGSRSWRPTTVSMGIDSWALQRVPVKYYIALYRPGHIGQRISPLSWYVNI